MVLGFENLVAFKTILKIALGHEQKRPAGIFGYKNQSLEIFWHSSLKVHMHEILYIVFHIFWHHLIIDKTADKTEFHNF